MLKQLNIINVFHVCGKKTQVKDTSKFKNNDKIVADERGQPDNQTFAEHVRSPFMNVQTVRESVSFMTYMANYLSTLHAG